MTERHIPRKARILGEISLIAAGAATVVTGGLMLHSRSDNENTTSSAVTQNNTKPFLGYSGKNEGFSTGTIVRASGRFTVSYWCRHGNKRITRQKF